MRTGLASENRTRKLASSESSSFGFRKLNAKIDDDRGDSFWTWSIFRGKKGSVLAATPLQTKKVAASLEDNLVEARSLALALAG